MTTSPTNDGIQDVPAQVFKRFLEALKGAGASDELIARLNRTLLEDKVFTETALKEAVLGEESVS